MSITRPLTWRLSWQFPPLGRKFFSVLRLQAARRVFYCFGLEKETGGWESLEAGALDSNLPSFKMYSWSRQITVCPAKLATHMIAAAQSRKGSSHRSRHICRSRNTPAATRVAEEKRSPQATASSSRDHGAPPAMSAVIMAQGMT